MTRSVVLAALLLVACKTARDLSPVGATSPFALGPPNFSFDSLDARPVSSDALRGKPSVLAFVTTWDLSSQAEVAYLVKMAEHDGDAVNYVLVALQEPDARELVEQYAKVMHVAFPVAMGNTASLDTGPLGDVSKIPTLVVLDDTGRVVYRASGVITANELRAHMPK